MKRRGSSPGGASLSAHRALNVLNEEAENNPQFQATQLWNRITRKFCKDVPRKRHRRNIRFYDDTFTGKEAIDFLLGVLPTLLDGNRDVTSSSHCFRLNDFKENRYVVLERLAPSVIQPSHSPEVPPAKAVQLVTCLMDHESRVFAVPERLLKAVADEAVAKPSAESNATPNRSTLSSAPAVSPDRQYCTVVDKNEYKSQEYAKSSIRELLTHICKNQSLTKCMLFIKIVYATIFFMFFMFMLRHCPFSGIAQSTCC
ncbi:hypothetical protein QR680_003142 [Steinernema hermaphroditum]|uniref:DEP domain-containing protein n=1 Tax=Steinernema hermaphroditum TaxID=289476 RepID=A0AA39H846_9BILA|nr:hypothetical protein QR680_003142 [Steinernema hermaphroditum]